MTRAISYAVEAMQGSLIWGSETAQWEGVDIDSRRLTGGELFIALAGERVDGHDFVNAAFEAGASGVVVEHQLEMVGQPETRGAGILVSDSFVALHHLTRKVRSEKPEHLVAVTGSAGKTTTKELLHRMLAKRFRTAASPGNFNNLYGFPLSLLNIPNDTEWMVAEMGMSEPGELGQVSALGQPEMAVFTNVGEAHLERLGSLEAVAEAKAELLLGLQPEGLVVANCDDPWVTQIAQRHADAGGPVVLYGAGEQAEVVIGSLQSEPGRTLFDLSTVDGSVAVDLRLHGDYNAWNFAAAAAAANQAGVDLESIAEVGLEIAPNRMRGRLVRVGGLTLIDDSYNSNPRAFKAALASASKLPCDRCLVVAGSMLELGDDAQQLHRQAGINAVECGFSLVVGVGEEARWLVDAANQAGAETYWYPDAPSASDDLVKLVKTGDLVLVKGSRGVALESLVERIERDWVARGELDAV